MKRNSVSKLFFAFIILGSIECNKPPCRCDFSPEQYIEVKFIDQQQQNLLSGPNPLLKIDSIQVLKEKNNFSINNASVRRGLIDSNNARFDFYLPAARSFLYYNQQTYEDTLDIKWVTKTGKCCDSPQDYNDIDSVKLNSALIKPVNGVYYFVK